MTGTNFRSDNVAPVADEIMAAITTANEGAASSYGEDAVSKRLEAALGDLFEREVRVHPVASGTAANCLALASLVAPGGSIVCHDGDRRQLIRSRILKSLGLHYLQESQG